MLIRFFLSFSRFAVGLGATPTKLLRLAIYDDDEAKAIDIYTTPGANGKCLSDELHPSARIASKNHNDQTPLHLACVAAMINLIKLFLQHGGNPNCPNDADQTSLQCLFLREDNDEMRCMVMELFLQWSLVDIDGESTVSINHVDVEGNAAIHYAARSGLLNCVSRLLAEGSIISLVNKDQMTCCEVADQAGYSKLADMLEAALVFQPVDELSSEYIQELDQQLAAAQRSLPREIVLDSQSMTVHELSNWIIRAKTLFCSVSGVDTGRALGILVSYEWNLSRAIKEYVEDPESALKFCQFETARPPPLVITAAADNNDNNSDNCNVCHVPASGPLDSNSILKVEDIVSKTDLSNIGEHGNDDDGGLDLDELCFEIDSRYDIVVKEVLCSE